MRVPRARGPTGAHARPHSPLATSAVMARTTGGLFVMGGVLGATLSALMPPDGAGNRAIVAATSLLAMFFGVGLAARQDRVDPTVHQVLVGIGTVLITVAIYASTSSAAALSLSCCYVFVACDAAFFFSRPWAAVQIAFAAASCMTVLLERPGLPWWSGLVPAGVTVTVGAVVGVLARLAADADIDALTGLLNRRGFDAALDHALARATRTGTRPALILVDLDRFATINTELGHRAGDATLQRISESWRELLGPTRSLARYGGDEFALLLPDMTEQDAVALAADVRAAITIGCSAGVTSWQPGESASFLVSRADMALYRAKQAGRNRTVLESSRRSPLAVELVEAIARESIDVAFQPIVSLADGGTTIGVEALLRWTSITTPGVTPADVIRVAEENGLIAGLDRLVLYRACTAMTRMQAATDDRRLILNVNVSGLELIEHDFVAHVQEVLRATAWSADQLVLEVTESVLDGDTPTAIAHLTELRARGIRIAIDDFGTGYSSLSRLKTLPTDFLKLDASFISAITPGLPTPPLLAVIALLSANLDLPVIVEGVENAHQAHVLADLGFALAQGFHYGRPLSAAALFAEATVPPQLGDHH